MARAVASGLLGWSCGLSRRDSEADVGGLSTVRVAISGVGAGGRSLGIGAGGVRISCKKYPWSLLSTPEHWVQT
jgi:hypothetical protein